MVGLTEFPKSGGTWVGQMLSNYLGISFPQRPRLPVAMSCVWHGHWGPPAPARILVVRDPRDCYVSLAHHRLSMYCSASAKERSSGKNASFRAQFPQACEAGRLQQADIDRYMELLLDGNRLGEPSWSEFHRSWTTANVRPIAVRYANLRNDPLEGLSALVNGLTGSVDEPRARLAVERYDFARLKSSPDGFVRRGVATGGWKDEVSASLHASLEQLLPEDLQILFTEQHGSAVFPLPTGADTAKRPKQL